MSSPPYNGDPRDEGPHLSVSEIAREVVRYLDGHTPNPHVRCKTGGEAACPNCYPTFAEMHAMAGSSENDRVRDLLAKWARKNKPITKHTIIELQGVGEVDGPVLALPLVDITRIRKLADAQVQVRYRGGSITTTFDYDQLIDMWEAAREDAAFEEPRFVGSLISFAKGEIRRVRAAEGELHVFGADSIVIAPSINADHPDFDALWAWLGEYGWLQA